MSEADSYFVKYRAKATGPHTRDEIATMVRKGTLSPIHRVSIDQENWRPLHELQGWQHLWKPIGEITAHKTEIITEPPPLPARAQQRQQDDDDPDEPVDVELLE